MARYEHLPIYKSAIDLAIFLETGVKNMSRYNKFAIGTELRKRGLNGLSLVVRANSIFGSKVAVLEELRINLEELRQLLFLAKETAANRFAKWSFELQLNNVEFGMMSYEKNFIDRIIRIEKIKFELGD